VVLVHDRHRALRGARWVTSLGDTSPLPERGAPTIPGIYVVELLLSEDDADELRDRGDLGLQVDPGAVSLH
jgi:hypothetical protein